MGISSELAKFVANTTWDDIPEEAKTIQKRSLLDGIAITYGAGTLGSGAAQCVDYAIEMAGAEGKGDCSVIGFNKKLPMMWAAFANGSMQHGLDFGDMYSTGAIHSNASTLAAVLAVAQHMGGVDGKKFLTAFILGSEVACRLSSAVIPSEGSRHGFYMPPVFTSIAATAAVCKLMDLDEEQIKNAFSITVSSFTCSAELKRTADTDIRSIRECFGAQAAINAAELAKRGIKGFDAPFEGKQGFYFAYYREGYNPEPVLKDLGKVYESAKLVYKPWPCCMGTHAAIKAALDIVAEHGVKAGDIESIFAEVPTLAASNVCEPDENKKHPQNSSNAKFSLPYTVAVAIIDGDVTLDSFDADQIKREDLLALAAKVSHKAMTEWDDDPVLRLGSRLTIKLNDGTEYTEWVKYLFGSLENPMADADFERKLRSSAKHAPVPPSDETLDKVIECVSGIEGLADIRELADLL